MGEIVYLNGCFVPRDEATVSVYDGGWLHGAGLFETMRAHRGTIFRLDAHLERLMNSAAKVLFPIDRPDLPLTRDFERLLRENKLSDARVRLTMTAGSMLDGLRDERPAITVCATASARTTYPAELYKSGIIVVIAGFRQSGTDPLAGHKTTNYLPRLLALREAQQTRCGEALWFTHRNLLAEGSISNVFVVKGGTLKTPPLDTPVLPGITRAVVLEISRREGTEVQETPLNIDDLLDADEVFITNSGMEVMPVIRVEQRDIGKGKPGPVTRDLMQQYRRQVEKECGGAATQ
ncbi:MAG: aminotransferase class IV [Phycisphaerae bacterium]|nr:aminotransferase class IV [Phycisphaerae bacterium]